ncbi:MAG TPA: SsrA-binding protein SmpB [Candidatus Saccharimonadales bacterium]|nr:SsrA-binding protein SmpB [Candidatus Saccharimonadales bacterium]
MAKKSKDTGKITNRRASYDYELGEQLVVGIQLTGAETKALRLSHGQLRGAYVSVNNNELWLVNAQINSTTGVPVVEETRSRKLLAKKREIERLLAARQAGNTIVPLEILTKGRFIKLRIAVGRGRKRYDKRETIRRREQQREAARSISR